MFGKNVAEKTVAAFWAWGKRLGSSIEEESKARGFFQWLKPNSGRALRGG